MKKAEKMNVLYLIGFILLFVCLALFAAAIVLMLVVENTVWGVIVSVAGVCLCLVAIILTMCSKPKPPRTVTEEEVQPYEGEESS